MAKTRLGMKAAAATLLLYAAFSVPSHAGRPVQPEPAPLSSAQIAYVLDSLPQEGTRNGGPAGSTRSSLSDEEREFVKSALTVVSTEARIGKLVSELGETEEVRSLGAELLANQTRNAAALREAARAKDFEPDFRPSAEQEALITSFRLKTAATMDSAFRDYVNNDRSGSIPIFLQGAKLAKDPNLRMLAEQVLGELRTERPIAAAAVAEMAAKNRRASEASKHVAAPSHPTSAIKRRPNVAFKPASSKASIPASPPASNPRDPGSTSHLATTQEPTSASVRTSTTQRPFRTKRDSRGRIHMAPMISADIAESVVRAPARFSP